MGLKSPCIDVCIFDGPTGWCIGCGRLRTECGRAWEKAGPFRRRAIRADLPRRLAKLKSAGRAPQSADA